MLGLTPQAHEVPSCWGRTETAFPWIQHPNVGSMETTTARAFHRKSLTQAALNISLLEDKTPQVLQPMPEML